jgi:hypothetical protein
MTDALGKTRCIPEIPNMVEGRFRVCSYHVDITYTKTHSWLRVFVHNCRNWKVDKQQRQQIKIFTVASSLQHFISSRKTNYTSSSAASRPITVRLRDGNTSNEPHEDWIDSELHFKIKFVPRCKHTPPSQSQSVDSEQGNNLTFCANHSKHINTSCGQKVGVLSVRYGDTYCHWALEGYGKNPMKETTWETWA